MLEWVFSQNFWDFINYKENINLEAQTKYYYEGYNRLWNSLYEPTKGELQGDVVVYTPISEFDWWNHPYYDSLKERFGW